MRFSKESLLLYAVTDRTWLGSRQLADQLEDALKGGATCVQIREKDLSVEQFAKEARVAQKVAAKYGVPFIVNDSVEVASAVNADGVHIGQSDKDAVYARKILGAHTIIGVSVQTVEQALTAQKNGADYLGVGALFSTSTKKDADSVSLETLRTICRAVHIPVVAIGGISSENVLRLAGSGIAGIAVVSALFAETNIFFAAQKLRQLAQEMVDNAH